MHCGAQYVERFGNAFLQKINDRIRFNRKLVNWTNKEQLTVSKRSFWAFINDVTIDPNNAKGPFHSWLTCRQNPKRKFLISQNFLKNIKNREYLVILCYQCCVFWPAFRYLQVLKKLVKIERKDKILLKNYVYTQ